MVPHNSIPWDAAAEGPRDFVWIQLARDVHQPDNQAHAAAYVMKFLRAFFSLFFSRDIKSKQSEDFIPRNIYDQRR